MSLKLLRSPGDCAGTSDCAGTGDCAQTGENVLSLYQPPGVFPLGQDSVLLSAFACPKPRGAALDLCAGSGALSLLLHLRFADLQITALERDQYAAQICRENFTRNHLDFPVLCADLRERAALPPHGCMDYVICNPPYFSAAQGKTHARLSTARQDELCTIDDAAIAAAFTLKQGGKCAMVYRPERLPALLDAFAHARLTPKRLRFVHQHIHAAPSAVLLEGKKGARPGLTVLPPFFVQTPDGAYTDEYRQVYHI